MSASAVFILDVKGKPLISRNYKGDIAMSEIEHFMPLLMQREEEGALAPLLSHGRVHFLWIKHSNLYLVATTLKNANASLVYSFLYKTVEVFSEYFKELEEESIRDNFVIVYELLDELMDFGFPQTTDSKILQEYITQQGNKLETAKSRVPPTVTNAVSWRSEGIKYKKNEVFIDVIESVNLLVNANGSVLLSEIVGTIKLKVFLSGMPELRLGLNDRVLFELTGRKHLGGQGRRREPTLSHPGTQRIAARSELSARVPSAGHGQCCGCWLIGANSASLLGAWHKYKGKKRQITVLVELTFKWE